MAHVASLFADSGAIAIVSVISPYEVDRQVARSIHEGGELEFLEVFVNTPLAECERRDPEGAVRAGSGREDHRLHRAWTRRTRSGPRDCRTSSSVRGGARSSGRSKEVVEAAGGGAATARRRVGAICCAEVNRRRGSSTACHGSVEPPRRFGPLRCPPTLAEGAGSRTRQGPTPGSRP